MSFGNFRTLKRPIKKAEVYDDPEKNKRIKIAYEKLQVNRTIKYKSASYQLFDDEIDNAILNLVEIPQFLNSDKINKISIVSSLNIEIFNTYVKRLETDKHMYHHGDDRYILEDPLDDFLIQSTDSEEEKNEKLKIQLYGRDSDLKDQVKSCYIDSKQIYFFIVNKKSTNYTQGHWGLVVFDNIKKKFHLYDSLHNYMINELKIVAYNLAKYNCVPYEHKKIQKDDLILPDFLPKQEDGWQCGYFILIYCAIMLLQFKEISVLTKELLYSLDKETGNTLINLNIFKGENCRGILTFLQKE